MDAAENKHVLQTKKPEPHQAAILGGHLCVLLGVRAHGSNRKLLMLI
jgi:hypothetical protein